jgi:hypothetical protein
MDLIEVEKRLQELYARRKEINENYETLKKANDYEIQVQISYRDLLLENIDIDKVKTATALVYVSGLKWVGCGDTIDAIDDAIADAVIGFAKLRKEFIGCKNYDRFTCQRSDHPYGYGPKHGSIVFRIELLDKLYSCSDEQLDCCIYFLQKLKQKNFREVLLRVHD